MRGIYKITNLINNKVYIGCSYDIEKRWKYHISNFNSQREYNKILYQAFRKYSIKNFSFEIVEENKTSEEMYEREKYWIEYYDSYKKGYNSTIGGEGNSSIGEKNSHSILKEEDIIQIRNSYKNNEPKIEVYREYFSDKISFSGFEAVWQGRTWKNILPEVFTEENKEKQIHRSLKDRVNKGEDNGNSKLTKEQVLEIINKLINTNISQTNLAKEYQVSYNTINSINCCTRWSHLHDFKNNIRKERSDAKCL